ILPAALEKFELAPVVDRAIILRAYVPNLRTDVIAPLKKAGYAREEIARLGGSMIAQKAKS
ncbi:MAG: hypothetical protein HY070_05170, partial [Chloroflexi bacterium]|nr:hypothetical protein [Chloroflexota bacterium]